MGALNVNQPINHEKHCSCVNLASLIPKHVHSGKPKLIPYPSLPIKVIFSCKHFIVTLDSGANVSFITLKLAQTLGLDILPNGSLAQLADPEQRMCSLGEVDFTVTEGSTNHVQLRIRALVMPRLAVPCYGGQTFHNDNDLVPNISNSTVTAHGGRFTFQIGPLGGPPPVPPLKQSLHDHLKPPEPPKQETAGEQTKTTTTILSGCTVLMKPPKSLLPSGVYPIPASNISTPAVLVLPPTPHPDDPSDQQWEPQICSVAAGEAMYVNNSTDRPLSHPKNTHFRLVPVIEGVASLESPLTAAAVSHTAHASTSPSVLKQIKVNTSLLSPEQLKYLDDLHHANIDAFNEDLREGFVDEKNPYRATFSFRKEHQPPPFKVWAPQFNTKCTSLLQAKCDQLEEQGVMRDPKKHPNIDIRSVSPCMITQKARAKHKPLEQCSLDEIRFICCFNVLNDSLHPIPGRSKSFNDILKFLAQQPFLICADLSNSYFQIKVDSKYWKYMGVMTPHRGLRVMTRLGQGLLNSDVDLDQVMGRVLGDEQTDGICLAARDDLFIGGNTADECLRNWGRVLKKLNKHNLKLNPRKVRILLGETEVFGHLVANGTVRPSDHIVSSLCKTSPSELKTVKQVNSWKGLYKTLIRHLPHLASKMAPFDEACKSKLSSSHFDWDQPGILAAFNSATSHLSEIQATYLPDPREQLVLQPDTSTSNICTGWSMYTLREIKGKTEWLPVQYASAKLAKYMATWTPCEKEGVGAVLAIDQTRHWINESRKPTIVMPDNKAVVDAANLMRIGRHSTSARLQAMLTSVNRSNVAFRHNSAKAGLHIVPDALSRIPGPVCRAKDCQVERFLEEMPGHIQCMPITMETLALSPLDPVTLACLSQDIDKLMGPGAGPIPLGSRQAWLNLQSDCSDCRRFVACKRDGQMARVKDKDKTNLNKMFKTCEVDKGLVISRVFDPILMKETTRIYVPAAFLPAILTIMHVRLSHPLPTQLLRQFERYFIAFNVRGTISTLTQDCSFCVAMQKFPKELDAFKPSPTPSHPGSHMGADILKRASQNILVTADRFSNFVTASFTPSETREDLCKALLAAITPIRHAHRVEGRTDRAPSLRSLGNRPEPELLTNGIEIVLGDHGNKNSNAVVDKMIQELEAELRRLDPEGQKISAGLLCQAVTNLNNRVRGRGFSASQIHFARDFTTGSNLNLKDERLRGAKEEEKESRKPEVKASKPPKKAEKGQLVYLKEEGSKHTIRNPLIVTEVGKKKLTVQKLLHQAPQARLPPRIQHDKLLIDPKFLHIPTYIPPHRRPGFQKDRPKDVGHQQPPPAPPPLQEWRPVEVLPDDDEDFEGWIQEPHLQLRAVPEQPVQTPEQMEGMERGEVGEAEADPILPETTRQLHKKKKRPLREKWIVKQPEAQVDEEQEEQAHPAEDVREAAVALGLVRTRKPPDRYGIEKERGDGGMARQNLSSTPEKESPPRTLTPAGSSPNLSLEQSLMESPPESRVPTPDTSPDVSLNLARSPFEPEWLPMTLPGRTKQQREDLSEKHRHWSIASGSFPKAFDYETWNPRPRGLPSSPPSQAEGEQDA